MCLIDKGCLSDSFILINQEGNSTWNTPLDGIPVHHGSPSIFSHLFPSLTDVIYVTFDSLTIQNPKMRTATMIDFSSHLMWLSPSPSQTDLRDLLRNWQCDLRDIETTMCRCPWKNPWHISWSAWYFQLISYKLLVVQHFIMMPYLTFYSPVSAIYIMRKKLRVFEWNTWLINNHSFVLVGYEMVDSQRGTL